LSLLDKAESNLARYGRLMLQSLPEETTQLLIDLCTVSPGSFVGGNDGSSTPVVTKSILPPSSSTSTGGVGSGPSYLSYLALGRSQPTTSITSDISPPSPSTKTLRQENIPSSSTVVPLFSSSTPQQQQQQQSLVAQQANTLSKQSMKLPSPRVYFAHFVDHMEQFVVFLETVAFRRYGQSMDEGSVVDHVSTHRRPKEVTSASTGTSTSASVVMNDAEDREDQVAIWNTLLELYLTLPGSEKDDGREGERGREFKLKAMKVLRSSMLPYDPTHALILCSTNGFTDGLILLWEKLGMFEDIIRFWISQASDSNDSTASRKVVETLKIYGPNRSNLYPLVLRFLTSTPEVLVKHREDLKNILEYIEQEGIMPPIAVVQLLSRNGVASVGLVKEWLMMRIREGKEEIEDVSCLPLYSMLVNRHCMVGAYIFDSGLSIHGHSVYVRLVHAEPLNFLYHV